MLATFVGNSLIVSTVFNVNTFVNIIEISMNENTPNESPVDNELTYHRQDNYFLLKNHFFHETEGQTKQWTYEEWKEKKEITT